MPDISGLRLTKHIALIALALLPQALQAAASDAAMDRYLERQIALHTATVTVISALSGDQLARLGAGYVLPMDDLGADSRTRIINAAKKAISMADYYLEDLPPDSRRVFWLFPKFSVTFLAQPLQSSGERIELGQANLAVSWRCYFYVASYPGDWRPQTSVMVGRDIWLAAATPETFSRTLDYKPPTLLPLKAPPKIDEIVSESPNDPKAKVEYLRKQAFHLLAPVGERWLARDPDHPFTYADFAGGKSMDIDDASAQQKEWLEKLYTNHRFGIDSRQPSWEDLGKVTAKLRVEYRLTIDVVKPVTDQGMISSVLSRPNSFSPREQMEWVAGGKTPLKFADGQAPPLYQNVSRKGMGWLLTR